MKHLLGRGVLSLNGGGWVFRFALLITKDPALSRWEIHKSDCPNVLKMIRRGAFAQILSGSSAESIKQTELGIKADGRTHEDIVIMPCCRAGQSDLI